MRPLIALCLLIPACSSSYEPPTGTPPKGKTALTIITRGADPKMRVNFIGMNGEDVCGVNFTPKCYEDGRDELVLHVDTGAHSLRVHWDIIGDHDPDGVDTLQKIEIDDRPWVCTPTTGDEVTCSAK